MKLVPENINEAIKHLTPKSDEELKSYFNNFTSDEKLQIGVQEDFVWLVQDALEKGADVHANNDWALRGASYYGHDKIVKILLDAGANVHAKQDYALQWASNNGHDKVVKILLDAGANVHADNDLALRWASQSGYDKIVKILKKAMGMNESIKHLEPRSKSDIENVMKGYGAYDRFFTAVAENLPDVIENLITSKEYAQLSAEDIRIGLINAAYRGNEEVVRVLIEKGYASPGDVNLNYIDPELIPMIKHYRKELRKNKKYKNVQ